MREALGLADGGSDAGLRAEADRAQLRASASTADGGTVPLWTAPTAGGGRCGYLRRLRADGGAQSAPGVGCSSEAITATPPRENAIELQAESSAASSALYGTAPITAARVVVTLEDGTTTSAKADRGWFVIDVPFALGGPADSPKPGEADRRPRSVKALSSTGELLATLEVALSQRGIKTPATGGLVVDDKDSYASGSVPSP